MEYAHKSLDLQDWVVVYTETVVGNPLRAKHVVRWILYHPGAFSKKRVRFESNALFFHWDLAFGTAATLGSRHVLRLGLFFRHEYVVRGARRQGVATLVRKGRRLWSDLPPITGTCIDGLKHRDIARILSEKEFLLSYDPCTAYLHYAALVGCIPVVIPPPRMTFSDWIAFGGSPCGVAFGFSDIPRAKATMPQLLTEISLEENREKESIKNFVQVCSQFGV